MSADPLFEDLVRRVRAGEREAAADLVRQFDPEIRRYIRLRLTDPALYRVFDSDDVLQSVLGNFFVRLIAGQYDLKEPEQLIRLLVTMAHNKIVDYARKPTVRRTRNFDSSVWRAFAATGQSPGEIVANEEILREIQDRLTEAEKKILELRGEGRSWREVADACGGTAEGARKTHQRALDRVCKELGLDEDRDE
jgi:RNA polymerase sigma-70 factor (ECF subfamily)